MKKLIADSLNDDYILIIADTHANLTMLAYILHDGGYKLHPVSNLELVWQSIKEKRPTLILLDEKLTETDAHEIFLQLKEEENTATIPIIFISNPENAASKAKIFRIGAADFISQPFCPEEVIAKVKTHVRLNQMQLNLERQSVKFRIKISERNIIEETLRESQTLYHSFVEHMPAGVFRKNSEGRYIFVNSVFCRLNGLRADDILCKTPHEIRESGLAAQSSASSAEDKSLQNLLVEQGENHHERIMRFGKPIEVEEVYTKPDGTRMYLQVVKSPVFSATGKVIGSQGIQFDVTERKEIEKNLIKANIQLKELNNTKDKLFSIIAHDLKNPFSSIYSLSEILCENLFSFDKEKTGKYMKLLNSTAKQTLALLDNLLDWAKTQTGQMNFRPKQINIQPIMQDMCNLSYSSARIKNISLNNFQSHSLVAYADPNMVQTILRNLISNAIKFTNTGGKIDLYATYDKKHIEITIADNGVGISEENMAKLFQQDSNLTTYGTANEKGSGLGLVLCKEFVEKNGGKIWVESEPGNGCKFHFSLPKDSEIVI